MESPTGCVWILHGITIGAAVWASVVGADVARFGTSAPCPVAARFGPDGVSGDVRQALGVDAAGRDGAGDEEFGLRAHAQPHAIRLGDGNERFDEVALGLKRWISPVKAVPRCRCVEVPSRFGVDLQKRDGDLVAQAAQRFTEAAEVVEVEAQGGQRGEEDGVVAPDKGARAVGGGQAGGAVEDAVDGRCGAFQFARVAGDRVLDDKGKAARGEGGQVAEKGADVFCPEHEAVDVAGAEADARDLAAVGVPDEAEAGAQAVHQPVAVKGRDVGAVAGRDDHGGGAGGWAWRGAAERA